MEQDPPLGAGTDDLPTYDDLAAQHGPNSRFGRWKSWVEKRAAERYAEDTPERREARRTRGWGPHVDTELPEPPPSRPSTPPQSQLRPPSSHLSRTQTVLSNSSPSYDDPHSGPSTSYITLGQALPPTHLKLHSFGSRFLPHSDLPILTLLPLFDDTKLLIGHMNGLSVLDMDPEAPLSELASKEPRRRDIWHGEGVYQLALLEHEQRSTIGTPQGVILALVGAEPPEGGNEKDSKELHRTIRMYNLSSLASITRWATAHKNHEPLDLSRPSNWQPQQPAQTRKHKQQVSISRGLKYQKSDMKDASLRVASIIPYNPDIPPPPPPKDTHSSILICPDPCPSQIESKPLQIPPPPPPKDSSILICPDPSLSRIESKPPQSDRSAESEWDVVGHDDLPLRWATDYVALASPGSRLANQSVLFFELHRCTDGGRITARLAIATKQNILLYESVRGERAFRFVKEFYTPIPARSARFIYQSHHEGLMRVNSPVSTLSTIHSATYSSGSRGLRLSNFASRRASSPSSLPSPYTFARGGQLSLFVVFEKKAGLIRVADSSVGEIDLWDESGPSPLALSPFRRSISSFEGLSLHREWKGVWVPPAEIILPHSPESSSSSSSMETVTVYLLTRGKQTHILPAPLSLPLAAYTPIRILRWGMHPTQVVPRLCEMPVTAAPFLQITALSEDGIEVQELSLALLWGSTGKGKVRDDAVRIVQADVGPGGAGFLCMGGHWTEHDTRGRTRHVQSLQRQVSASTVDTMDLSAKRSREQGFYAWTQKGYDDWRVFWLGGDSDDDIPPATP